MRQNVTILGSTGSIGTNTLDVIARHPQRFHIYALTAHSQVDKLYEQCLLFKPDYAVLLEESACDDLRLRLKTAGSSTTVLHGVDALEKVSSLPTVDTVVAAIVGAAGLRPTMAAAKAGKRILLANKETLVVAGPLFMRAVQDHKATLLPIDSEHNAIFQSLPHNYDPSRRIGVKAIHLTASGGPFRQRDVSTFADITPEEACKHPNWTMGRKISVDSASMMNKGLEVIEARWLFDLPPEMIQVVIHPQSVVHSLVEYLDGSFLAQLGTPDMRTPIAYALAYPERIEAGVEPLDFRRLAALTFETPDEKRYPCLKLAYDALKATDYAPAVLNAANEVAVAAFLERRLGFTDIPRVIEESLSRCSYGPVNTIEDLLEIDADVRRFAEGMSLRRATLPC